MEDGSSFPTTAHQRFFEVIEVRPETSVDLSLEKSPHTPVR
ncbi:hypothetical protein BSM4216_2949 [Bacillus smithii]|nr:hypothetical protein BSM4216_2949 [Bacillus smithii]